VVSVYEVDPYPRTAKSILGLEQPPERKRPRPENKRTWARVEADQGTVIEQACAEAARHDPDQQMRWVVLTDSQPDLLRRSRPSPSAIRSIPWWPRILSMSSKYLWKAAYAYTPRSPKNAKAGRWTGPQPYSKAGPKTWR